MLVNLSIFLGAFLFVFFAVEVGIRLYIQIRALTDYVQHLASLSWEESGKPIDVCDFDQYQDIGYMAYEIIGYPSKREFQMRPNNKFEVMGFEALTNSVGLRDQEYSIEKPVNTYRVAIVGDSVTFGLGVKQEEGYPEVLEKKLQLALPHKNVEVINFGIPAYNGQQKLAMIAERAVEYNPDIIVFGHLIDDMGHASVTSLPIPTFLAQALNKHSYLFSCFRKKTLEKFSMLNNTPYKMLFHEHSPAWKAYRDEVVSGLVTIKRERNIPILVVMLPVLVGREKLAEDGIVDIHHFLSANFESAGLASIDILSLARNKNMDQYRIKVNDLYHPNAAGHELIAQAIFEALVQKNLLRK